MLHARDLPPLQEDWAPLLTAAMGMPDPYGRQFDGMGGGVSSLSKVCVIAPFSRSDADVDYTFTEVLVREAAVQYRGNCGNMSSAVDPFVVDEELVRTGGDTATVRIFNTNTSKIIHGTFPVEDGMARYDGDLAIPGVSGTGAPIRLDFVLPGGASTGKLLPSGSVLDRLDVSGVGRVEASLVDAASAAVFVRARDVGLTRLELPEQLEARPDMLALLEAIRMQSSVCRGIVPDLEAARQITIVPFVCFVALPDRKPDPGRGVGAGQRGGPGGARDLEWPAASGTAVDHLALHGGRRTDRRHSGGAGSVPHRRRRAVAARHALRRADRGRRGDAGGRRLGGTRRLFYRTARRLFDGRVWRPSHARHTAAIETRFGDASLRSE